MISYDLYDFNVSDRTSAIDNDIVNAHYTIAADRSGAICRTMIMSDNMRHEIRNKN